MESDWHTCPEHPRSRAEFSRYGAALTASRAPSAPQIPPAVTADSLAFSALLRASTRFGFPTDLPLSRMWRVRA